MVLTTRKLLLSLLLPLAGGSAGAEPKTEPAHPEPTRADVIVYGATPGGVCAAIAAAREGVSVILL